MNAFLTSPAAGSAPSSFRGWRRGLACLAVAGGVLAAGPVRADYGSPISVGTDEAPRGDKAYSLVMTNGYGDCYRMNLLRNRDNYQAYRGSCSYRGFSLSGCSTTGEVVMLRIKATPSMPEHSSIVSTSLRWGTTMYFLNDLFHPLCSWVSAGYENWYPFDMSCSVAMYINSGGYGVASDAARVGPRILSAPREPDGGILGLGALTPPDWRGIPARDFEPDQALREAIAGTRAFSLVMTNGYGDCYRMNLLRDRENYQAYRGICSYRGFSLSGCSTTGEVVMLRIKATPSMPEHFSLLSTSLRWGTTMYVLNDVFRPLCSWVMAGYENWYPFDMSCSVAMYINAGGFGVSGRAETPRVDRSVAFDASSGTGTNAIGVLLPLTGDLGDVGQAYLAAYQLALSEITNTPGMPALRLDVRDTRTDAGIAFDQLVSLSTGGVRVVLGPESSDECQLLRQEAEARDMLLISSSSTAAQLAITNDNLMRLTLDDRLQARALAERIRADGITDICLLARSDIYGEGLMNALVTDFQALGGTVFSTNFAPRAEELFAEVMSNLNVIVADRLAVVPAGNAAMVAVMFGEGVEAMRQAAPLPALAAVRWYGAEGMAQNHALLTNAAAADLAVASRFTCSAFGRFTNALYDVVEAHIAEQTGVDAVPRYPISAYDGLWLTALALQSTGGTQTTAQLRAAIRAVAADVPGATGPILFNAADDRTTGSYDFWTVTNGCGSNQWVLTQPDSLTPPSGVAASPGSFTDKVRVTWNEVSGASAYDLWRHTAPDAAAAQRVATNLVATAFDDPAAQVKRSYYYWVRATNAAGYTAMSLPAEGWRRGLPAGYGASAPSDLAVFDPVSGHWYIATLAGGLVAWAQAWGWPGAVPVPGDYDADGRSDLAVFDPAAGAWYAQSLSGQVLVWNQAWGWAGAVPVPGDYDGDGRSDLAVYDAVRGLWYLATAQGRLIAAAVAWGLPGAVPVPGDYDGDALSDLAVVDPAAGTWYIRSLAGPVLLWQQVWGAPGTVPVPGDYDGDRRDDLAIFDPAAGLWYIRSVAGALVGWALPWGWPGAVPVAGDFDGDGLNDLAVFDPATGAWYIRGVGGTVAAWAQAWGWPGALPVSGAAW